MNFSGFLELNKIALRSLARHKVKTVLTCAAIMISVALYIWMESWLEGMSFESRRNIVNYEIGAAKLQTKLYFDKKDDLPGYENFSGWERYAQILDEAGYNTAPRFTFSGSLYSLAGSSPLVVYAVDPDAEARTLAYTTYVDFGRFIKSGEFGIVLGARTADKLKLGIPERPTAEELDDLAAAVDPADAGFIRSCYGISGIPGIPEAKAGFAETKGYADNRSRRMVLRRDLSKADMDRLWDLLDATGRNDVRIFTVIDYKIAPDNIRRDKWDSDLRPNLTPQEAALVGAAYEFDEPTDSYLLIEDDTEKLGAALAAMIRVDFSGAVRHVNQVIDAKVVGILNSPDPATNFNAAYIPLDVLAGEEGMMLEGRITELLIRDKTLGAADMNSKIETQAVIRKALDSGLAKQGLVLPAELDVFFWTDYVQDYLGYEALESGGTKIFSILLFFLALIGISNTMLLAILERTKEIGMMRAMGMTNGQMVFCYMAEACFLGLIGSALGIILGCAINYPTVKYGFNFSEMMDQLGGSIGYRISGNFRGMWSVPVIIGSGVTATVLSSLMAFFPTRRAVKMEITESLRFE